MSTLGTWVKFTKLDEKGIRTTNDDLIHGCIESVGEQVSLPLKKGNKVVVSAVKKMQDLQNGITYYYVEEKQIMDILS